MPLEDILRDRTKLMKLFWLGFWAGIALMIVGYLMIFLKIFE